MSNLKIRNLTATENIISNNIIQSPVANHLSTNLNAMNISQISNNSTRTIDIRNGSFTIEDKNLFVNKYTLYNNINDNTTKIYDPYAFTHGSAGYSLDIGPSLSCLSAQQTKFLTNSTYIVDQFNGRNNLLILNNDVFNNYNLVFDITSALNSFYNRSTSIGLFNISNSVKINPQTFTSFYINLHTPGNNLINFTGTTSFTLYHNSLVTDLYIINNTDGNVQLFPPNTSVIIHTFTGNAKLTANINFILNVGLKQLYYLKVGFPNS